jgi:hypothetical protein
MVGRRWIGARFQPIALADDQAHQYGKIATNRQTFPKIAAILINKRS